MSFVWFCHDLGYRGEQLRYGALAVTVSAALLMVSRFRYFSFKSGPRNDRVPFLAIIVGVCARWSVSPSSARGRAAGDHGCLCVVGTHLLDLPARAAHADGVGMNVPWNPQQREWLQAWVMTY